MVEPSRAVDGVRTATASMDGVGLVGRERLEYTLANDRLAEIHGYETGEDLVGSEWPQMYQPVGGDRTSSELLERVREERCWQGPATGRGRDGTRVPVHLSMQATDEGIVCVVRERPEEDVSGPGPHRVDEQAKRLVDATPLPAGVVTEDRGILYCNRRAVEFVGADAPGAVVGRDLGAFVHADDRERLRQRLHRVCSDRRADEPTPLRFDGIDGRERAVELSAVPIAVKGSPAALVMLGDGVGNPRWPERSRQGHRRDERRAPERLDRRLFETVRALFKSPPRQDIEELVCERLAASELYEVVWSGSPVAGSDQVIPRVCTGGSTDRVERLGHAADRPGSQGLTDRAFTTGEVQVTRDVHIDLSSPTGPSAAESDVRAAAAVPLVHRGTVYGVLAVYTSRRLGFAEHERTALEALGEAVGFALGARETHELLFADTVVEVELEIGDPRLAFVRVWEQCDSRIRLADCVAADGAWSVFLDIAGEPPGCLSEMPAVDSEIRTVEVVEAGSDESRVEVVLRESALNAVTGAGAILTGGRIENGRARLTVEVPLSSDTRGFVGRVQNRYPESTVVAIRERDRSVQTAREFRQSVGSRLTERQCEALHRAYAHGYFEWPRSNNASEVAASMTIAESTFHYHLRRALQKLLGSYLDADAGTEPIGSESRHG